MRIGLVGAGAMGSALGANWAAGGSTVITSTAGRSPRTVQLAQDAGITLVDSFDDVMRVDVVVSTVPPAAAVDVARTIAAAARRAGSRPVVADLNAVSPQALGRIATALGGLELIDGSISGGPPGPDRPTYVYLGGARAPWFASIPAPWLEIDVLGPDLGTASALKMCTASMYKGTTALVLQAMVTARRHGVLDAFLDDVGRAWPDRVPSWPHDVAMAASKADRYVGEMREIAVTQQAAGVAGELFAGIATVWARVASTPMGRRTPEDVPAADDLGTLLDGVVATSPAAVLFDFSGTLFHIESAEQALLAALGPSFVERAPAVVSAGGLNGSHRPASVPDRLAAAWDRRDLSADAHRTAYSGSAVHAGLSESEAALLYERGIAPDAWHPYPDTVRTLRALHVAGVPVAIVSNIGWDPRPVLARYGVDADVDLLVLSDERGLLKPDPAIFALACTELGVDPASTVMVGDDRVNDDGGRPLGINYRYVVSDPGTREPDALWRAAGLT